MLAQRRSSKLLTATLFGGLVAFALSTGFAEGRAQAQISGSIGGDLVGDDELATALSYTLTNTMISGYLVQLEGPDRAAVSADVTTTDADGDTHTTRIIAVLIALFAPRAPGFMDYTDDACLADDAAPSPAQSHACAQLGRAFRTVVQARRVAVSPRALLAQSPRGLAIWDPR
jgi:hypothetical protein